MLILHFPLEMMPYSIPIVLLILFTFFTEVENIYFYLNGLGSSDPDLNSKWTMDVGVGVLGIYLLSSYPCAIIAALTTNMWKRDMEWSSLVQPAYAHARVADV